MFRNAISGGKGIVLQVRMVETMHVGSQFHYPTLHLTAALVDSLNRKQKTLCTEVHFLE